MQRLFFANTCRRISQQTNNYNRQAILQKGAPSKRRTFASTVTSSATFLPLIHFDLLPYICAILLYARKDDESPPLSPDDSGLLPYTVRSTDGRGKGAFASETLARGDVILSEQPLIIWPPGLDAKAANKSIAEMTPDAREVFESLVNSQPTTSKLDPALGIRGSNGFDVQLPEIDGNQLPSSALKRWQGGGEPNSVTMIFP